MCGRKLVGDVEGGIWGRELGALEGRSRPIQIDWRVPTRPQPIALSLPTPAEMAWWARRALVG